MPDAESRLLRGAVKVEVLTAPHAASIECRVCGHIRLKRVLCLGEMPLANALLNPEDPETKDSRLRLTVARCADCGITQLLERVPRELLFREYNYFSSCSSTLVASAQRLAERTIADEGLNGSSLVLEIASNDGYLLQHYATAGIPVLGIEPAANIARFAQERGIETRCDFFSLELARQLMKEGIRPRVIHAHNVLAHVEDLSGVLDGVRLLLGPDGVFIVKVPYLRDLVENLEFDTIYHEHNFYFTVEPFARLLASRGLRLANIEHAPLHGGSLRMWIVRDDSSVAERSCVHDAIAREQADGVNEDAFYTVFEERVSVLRAEVVELLQEASRQGMRVAGYGAAAKATQLLNYFGLGRDVVRYVCDISPYKQGRLIPGVRTPVVCPEVLLEDQPDLVLLLAWNFADEILEQQAEYRRRGGKFLIPLPEPRIV